MNRFKSVLALATFVLTSALVATAAAVTPAQEKAFIDAYRTAYVKKDAKALEALLYTQGADPMALEFYKMMISADTGGTITSIQLVDLTAEDQKKLESGKSPDGRPMKMTLKPVKKLVVKTATKTASSNSTGSSESFVAEHQGKLCLTSFQDAE